MARYPAMSAALPALGPRAPGSSSSPAVLPAEVATDDDVEARAALLRVLARAARADGSGRPAGVQFLGSGATPEEIALAVLGRGPRAGGTGPRPSRTGPTPTGASSSSA